MTEALLLELERWHVRCGPEITDDDSPYCRGCREQWPCPMTQVLAEVRELQVALRQQAELTQAGLAAAAIAPAPESPHEPAAQVQALYRLAHADKLQGPWLYPHMCRDGHAEIGHRTDEEMCPACIASGWACKLRAVLVEADALYSGYHLLVNHERAAMLQSREPLDRPRVGRWVTALREIIRNTQHLADEP